VNIVVDLVLSSSLHRTAA